MNNEEIFYTACKKNSSKVHELNLLRMTASYFYNGRVSRKSLDRTGWSDGMENSEIIAELKKRGWEIL